MGNRIITDKDRLKVGDCTCVVKDKYTGYIRLAKGGVDRVPYKKNASMESKKKYGKNIVYVIHRPHEQIIGYYQTKKQVGK